MKRSLWTLLLVLLVPALTGLVTLAAAADRVTNVDLVPAAVVNVDEMVEMEDGTVLPAGRLLAAELTAPLEEMAFDWQIVAEDVAADGLNDGTYYAVVTIPAEFSQGIVDVLDAARGLDGADVPGAAKIELESSNPASPLMARLSGEVAQAAADSLGRFFTEQYLAGSMEGSGMLADGMREAADGADQLADGTLEAEGGAAQIAGGTGELADGLSLLSGGAGSAAVGAQDLASGAGQLASGAELAAGGAGALASGAGELAAGVSQVDAGAGALAAGASELSGGMSTFASGVGELKAGTSELASGTTALADGARQIAAGTREMADGLAGLGSDSGPLGVDLDELMAGVSDALDVADAVVAGLVALEAEWDSAVGTLPSADQVLDEIRAAYGAAVAEQCAGAVSEDAVAICEALAAVELPGAAELEARLQAALAEIEERLAQIPTGDPRYPTFADVLAAAREAAGDLESQLPSLEEVEDFLARARELVASMPEMLDGVQQLADGMDALAAGASELDAGVQELDAGIGALASGASQLAGGTSELAAGAGALAGGTSQLADGAGALADGMRQYAGGASELASGAQLLAGGSGQLADGVVQLADGASASASGAGQLADGTAELADGLGQLWDGTTQLAGGLRDGADEIPVFTAEEARALAATLVRPVAVDDVTTGVMAGPVVEASPRGERVAAWTEFAPTVGAIALWLGALASSLVLEALPARRRFEAGGPVRLAWAGMWPGLVAAVIQAALLVGVLAAFGVRFASWWTVLVVAVVAAASFTALNQGLVAVFGRKVGLVTSLVLGVLQLAVLTTLMPAVAGPAVLQPLAGVLPVGLAADGFTRGVLGGWVTSATTAVVGLAVWGAVGHAMSALGARRRQAIDVSELRAASSGRIAAAGS